MALPTIPHEHAEQDPLSLRILLAGAPKSGKTTLMSGWSPRTTLIIDTQGGTKHIAGKHLVAPASDWPGFVELVKELVRGKHEFRTVVVDMIDDVWRWCDVHHAPRGKMSASSANDFQASIRQAELTFYKVLGNLMSTDLGVTFTTHTTTRMIDGDEQELAKLDRRVYGWVSGVCDIIGIVEGERRLLHTQPTPRFQAGCRLDIPSPLPLDPTALYAACKAALAPADTNPHPSDPMPPVAPQEAGE